MVSLNDCSVLATVFGSKHPVSFISVAGSTFGGEGRGSAQKNTQVMFTSDCKEKSSGMGNIAL
jgi:hypothetical protein